MLESAESNINLIRKPHWLKIQLPKGEKYLEVKEIVNNNKLKTICQSGHCPNLGECWSEGTATFMILGNTCTRNCTFCNIRNGNPLAPDLEEPERVANAVRLMKLKHCVITSVTRDDLKDKGAFIWASTIREVKKANPDTTIEVLIPDMMNKYNALNAIINEKPEIISHNIETIQRLYKTVRPQADYNRSLRQIKKTKESGILTKSGFMVGLGESFDEVIELLQDLRENGLDIITIGQYLRPTQNHHPVIEYVEPEKFKQYKEIAFEFGFLKVESAPLVRSSYHSERHVLKNIFHYNKS